MSDLKMVKQMGADGYATGLRAPSQDAKLMKMLKDIRDNSAELEFGWTLSYLTAWNKGWSKAHNEATKVAL